MTAVMPAPGQAALRPSARELVNLCHLLLLVVTRDVTLERTDSGWERNVTITGPDGKTHTRSGAGQ
jgi:hypothetical protein